MEQKEEFPRSLKPKFEEEFGPEKGGAIFALLWGITEGQKLGEENNLARLSALRRDNQFLRKEIAKLRKKIKDKNG